VISIVSAQPACDGNHAYSRQPVITHKFDVNRSELLPLRKLSISCPRHPNAQKRDPTVVLAFFLLGFCPLNKCRTHWAGRPALGVDGFLAGDERCGDLGMIGQKGGNQIKSRTVAMLVHCLAHGG